VKRAFALGIVDSAFERIREGSVRFIDLGHLCLASAHVWVMLF
jgi:hypothetical protein